MLSDQKLSNARIPKAYWGITLEVFKKRTFLDQGELAKVEDYMAYLRDHRSEGLGLLFVGKPGTGKSLLASLVLQEAVEQGMSGLFLTMPELIRHHHQLRELKDAWTIMKDTAAYEQWLVKDEALEALRNRVDFVVLDDVGKEHTTTSGYSESVFDDLFRHRYSLGLPTIITTNVEVEKWEGRYSASMADFISEACIPVGFTGSSFRRRARD